jgi:ankyrin repeat protein
VLIVAVPPVLPVPLNLMHATVLGNVKAVVDLLRRGADPNQTDHQGATCLLRAVKARRGVIVEELLRHGADVNIAKGGGWSPLHEAALEGLTEIAAILINAGADVNLRSGAHSGWTPLFYTARWGHKSVAEKLLMAGADVNCFSWLEGWTPLHFATCWGRCDMVRLLIECGADVNKAGFSQDTPLDITEDPQRVHPIDQEVVEILQMHGAKKYQSIRSADSHRKAPLAILDRE